MSQWGSFGYAVDYGWSYTKILDHYYGGTVMGTVPNSTMTIRLRAQTGKNLIVTGTSMRINGTATSRKALRVVRVGANKFRVDGANACGGPWTIGAARTGPVVISRPGWNTTRSSTLLGVCSSNQVRYYGGTLTSVDAGGVHESVDAIPLETYLRGVVPRESPAYWGSGGGGKGINALRSQAVAARSYALASTNTSYAKTCDTTECQVYGGMYLRAGSGPVEALHSANSDRAVADTRGKVRKYRSTGAIARTEFGASSGGWTAGETFPAVQDLGDDTTDQTGLHNPYHNWTFKFSMAQVESALGISGITDIRVTATAGVGPTGGKATRTTVYAASGQYTFDGDTIRRAFGLYSNWFRITTDTAARRSATSVVQALYHDLLGRPADAAGLRTWVNRMVAGGSAKQVADALTASAEYSRVVTKRLYAGATGATPNASTLEHVDHPLEDLDVREGGGDGVRIGCRVPACRLDHQPLDRPGLPRSPRHRSVRRVHRLLAQVRRSVRPDPHSGTHRRVGHGRPVGAAGPLPDDARRLAEQRRAGALFGRDDQTGDLHAAGPGGELLRVPVQGPAALLTGRDPAPQAGPPVSTAQVSLAYASQVPAGRALASAVSLASNSSSVSRARIASVTLSSSRGSTSSAPPPASAISFMAPKFEVITGVPQASDSATGSPKPSLTEGKTVNRAAR